MINLCMVLMGICLATEGIILLFSGFPLPGQPLLLYAVGALWAMTSISLFFFRGRPLVTVVLGCTLFAVNAYDLWFHTNEEKSLPWFLYQHSVEIIFIAFSCIGLVLIGRRKKPTSPQQIRV